MADKSSIEWTDATWQPITGCSVVSPGCTNCYAMRLAGTRLQHHPSRAGLTTMSKAGPVWNGQMRFNEQWLLQPLQWKKPRRIFVCAHGDLFHESVPDEWIDKVFAVMALAPQHTFQVLTKRSKRMRNYMTAAHERIIKTTRGGHRNISVSAGKSYHSSTKIGGEYEFPLPNVWLGVSAEDQQRADERIPDLLATPVAVRFISAELLLGRIDLRPWLSEDDGCEECDDGVDGYPNHCSRSDIPREQQCPRKFAVHECDEGPLDADGCPKWVGMRRITLDWVIAGGESGKGARPMHPDWARGLRDQCAAAGVPFFFKQWGNWREAQEGDQFDTSRGRLNKPPAFIITPDDGTVHCFLPDNADPGCRVMIEVGKARAGRLLDGVEHNGMLG